MFVVTDSNIREDVMNRTQDALNRHQPKRYRVHAAEVFQDDDNWFHVVVESEDDNRDNEFYDALTRAEVDLGKTDPAHTYLLVPVIASE